MKIQCAKVKDEVAELRQKVEQAKVRLAAQFQTRERLETEVKSLKQEVMQKKINLSLIRSKVH
jgi:predicted RNase H-like nuclease (RuvC/YqgF family)